MEQALINKLDEILKDFKDKVIEITDQYVIENKTNPVNVEDSCNRMFERFIEEYEYRLKFI